MPVKLATGIARLDSIVQASWYQTQIDRMGHGREPDIRLSRFLPLLRYLSKRRVTRLGPSRGSTPPRERPRANAHAETGALTD
jgi:hypothetical protein